jgi:hypothetical protein
MGRDFGLLEVWHSLASHDKWWKVLRPLVLRGEAKRDASSSATGSDVTKATRHKPRSKFVELHNEFVDYEEKMGPCHPEESVGEGFVGVESDAEDSAGLANQQERGSAGVPLLGKMQRVTGAKRRKPTPRRVCPRGNEDHESDDPGTADINAGNGELARVETQVGDAAVVTPTNASKKKRIGVKPKMRTSSSAKAGQSTAMENKVEKGVEGQHQAAPAAVPENVEVAAEQDRARGPPPQYLEDVNLVLAWISVCCSFSDLSPHLDEANDWFWFLVSSVYYDLAPNQIHISDVESMLKDRWQQIRRPVANFQKLYEASLSDKSPLARADREAAVTVAQEAYWAHHGHWFLHRAVWEILERHTDWDAVLKPLLLGTEASKSVPKLNPPTSIPGDSELSADSNAHVNTPDDEAKSDESADPVDSSSAAKQGPVGGSVNLKMTDSTNLTQPEFVVVAIGKAETEKQRLLARQWLDLSRQQLELRIMTRGDEGLTTEGIEYLRLRRERILNKQRLDAVGK